jgi:hypothetical protein
MTKKIKEKNNTKNLFTSGFEIEGEEDKKTENDSSDDSPFGEPTVIETKVEKTKIVEPVELSNEFIKDVDKTFNVFDFEKQSSELFSLSKKLSLIKDDDDNQNARDLAKQMTTLKNKIEEARKEANKPDQQKIDSRMESAKKITEPLTKELDRLKQCVSFYESEKERKRLLEKKKLEDEMKAKEEKEKKEHERVANIRKEIDRLRIDGQSKVNACNTIKEITDLELKLKGWKLKPEFFSEFIEEAEGLKNEISELLAKRKPLIVEIENKKLEAEKLEGENKLQAQRETEAKQKELEAQNKLREEENRNKELQDTNMELAARQELIVLVASFGISKGVEEYMDNVIAKYGNCRLAMDKRDKLVDDYREYLSNKVKMDAIDSEKVKNVRLTFEFSIIDEDLIPREFMSVDETKIRKALVENRKKLEEDVNGYKIEGLLIYPKKQIIVK